MVTPSAIAPAAPYIITMDPHLIELSCFCCALRLKEVRGRLSWRKGSLSRVSTVWISNGVSDATLDWEDLQSLRPAFIATLFMRNWQLRSRDNPAYKLWARFCERERESYRSKERYEIDGTWIPIGWGLVGSYYRDLWYLILHEW